MIFVTVGSSDTPFDRLLHAVATLELQELLLVQHGVSSVRPLRAVSTPFLPFDELVGRIREARVVICHGGVGSILLSLAHGKRPIVMPRRRELGEAVDHHQKALCARLSADELVTVVEHAEGLAAAVRGGVAIRPRTLGGSTLAAELRSYIQHAVSRSESAELVEQTSSTS